MRLSSFPNLLALVAATAVGCGGAEQPGQPDAGPDASVCVDGDGDGYGDGCVPGPDCRDDDAEVHPGAPERCDDLVDNDCDDTTPGCYGQIFDAPGVCDAAGRTCTGHLAPGAGGALSLALPPLPPRLYVAVANKNEIAAIDTDTGEKRWQRPTFGVSPSRTAVALDGTVWVGNRCLSGADAENPGCSNAVHLDLDGHLICRADVPGWVRGMAIDPRGHVWAGTWYLQSVVEIDPDEVDTTQPPPRCKILGTLDVGVDVYGLAADARGFLWTATSPTKKIDTRTRTVVDTVANPSAYGIAVDAKQRVWFGGWGGDGLMHRIDGDPPYTLVEVPGTRGVTGVTVHPDGSIWGSVFCDKLCAERGLYRVSLDANDLPASVQYFADPDGQINHGVAVDQQGKIWSPQVWAQGTVNRWSASGTHEARVTVDLGQELYSYSDMTGMQLRAIVDLQGRWLQIVDAGDVTPRWGSLAWTATATAPATVTARVRAADDPAALEGAPWCGPFVASPADLTGCADLAGHRHLQLELALAGKPNAVPTLARVELTWSD